MELAVLPWRATIPGRISRRSTLAGLLLEFYRTPRAQTGPIVIGTLPMWAQSDGLLWEIARAAAAAAATDDRLLPRLRWPCSLISHLLGQVDTPHKVDGEW